MVLPERVLYLKRLIFFLLNAVYFVFDMLLLVCGGPNCVSTALNNSLYLGRFKTKICNYACSFYYYSFLHLVKKKTKKKKRLNIKINVNRGIQALL